MAKVKKKPVKNSKSGLKALKAKTSGKTSPVKSKLNGATKKAKSISSRTSVKQAAVPHEAKARVIASAPQPLTAEMLQIRQRLMSMLSDLRKDIDHEVRGASERDLAHINDTSDMASDSAEGDLSLRIAESETAEAGEIERALEKLDNGTYGLCESCNKAINADRLQFLPYSTLCIKCQELAEIRKRDDGDELDDLAEGSESDSENN